MSPCAYVNACMLSRLSVIIHKWEKNHAFNFFWNASRHFLLWTGSKAINATFFSFSHSSYFTVRRKAKKQGLSRFINPLWEGSILTIYHTTINVIRIVVVGFTHAFTGIYLIWKCKSLPFTTYIWSPYSA